MKEKLMVVSSTKTKSYIAREIARCFRGEHYCDVIICDEKGSPCDSIMAHRLVLAAASPLLCSILQSHPETETQIILNAPFTVMKALTSFIYGQSIVYNYDSVEDRALHEEILGWLKVLQIDNYSQDFSWESKRQNPDSTTKNKCFGPQEGEMESQNEKEKNRNSPKIDCQQSICKFTLSAWNEITPIIKYIDPNIENEENKANKDEPEDANKQKDVSSTEPSKCVVINTAVHKSLSSESLSVTDVTSETCPVTVDNMVDASSNKEQGELTKKGPYEAAAASSMKHCSDEDSVDIKSTVSTTTTTSAATAETTTRSTCDAASTVSSSNVSKTLTPIISTNLSMNSAMTPQIKIEHSFSCKTTENGEVVERQKDTRDKVVGTNSSKRQHDSYCCKTSNSLDEQKTSLNSTSTMYKASPNIKTEPLYCKICNNKDVRLKNEAEYFSHLKMHLQKMNELCGRLTLHNGNKCDVSVINIRCPGCEKLVLLRPEANDQQIDQIHKHVKKCSWLIVSERQRLHSKSKKQGQETIRTPLKSYQNAIWSLKRDKSSKISTSSLPKEKELKRETIVSCNACGRFFLYNISLKKHVCRKLTKQAKHNSNIMTTVFTANFNNLPIQDITSAGIKIEPTTTSHQNLDLLIKDISSVARDKHNIEETSQIIKNTFDNDVPKVLQLDNTGETDESANDTATSDNEQSWGGNSIKELPSTIWNASRSTINSSTTSNPLKMMGKETYIKIQEKSEPEMKYAKNKGNNDNPKNFPLTNVGVKHINNDSLAHKNAKILVKTEVNETGKHQGDETSIETDNGRRRYTEDYYQPTNGTYLDGTISGKDTIEDGIKIQCLSWKVLAFQCWSCGQRFSREGKRRKHEKEVHGVGSSVLGENNNSEANKVEQTQEKTKLNSQPMATNKKRDPPSQRENFCLLAQCEEEAKSASATVAINDDKRQYESVHSEAKTNRPSHLISSTVAKDAAAEKISDSTHFQKKTPKDSFSTQQLTPPLLVSKKIVTYKTQKSILWQKKLELDDKFDFTSESDNESVGSANKSQVLSKLFGKTIGNKKWSGNTTALHKQVIDQGKRFHHKRKRISAACEHPANKLECYMQGTGNDKILKPRNKHRVRSKSNCDSSAKEEWVDSHNNIDGYTSSYLETLKFGKFKISKKRRTYERWIKERKSSLHKSMSVDNIIKAPKQNKGHFTPSGTNKKPFETSKKSDEEICLTKTLRNFRLPKKRKYISMNTLQFDNLMADGDMEETKRMTEQEKTSELVHPMNSRVNSRIVIADSTDKTIEKGDNSFYFPYTPPILDSSIGALIDSPPPLRTLFHKGLKKEKRKVGNPLILAKKYPHLLKYSGRSSSSDEESETHFPEKRRRKSLPYIKENTPNTTIQNKRKALKDELEMRSVSKSSDESFFLVKPKIIEQHSGETANNNNDKSIANVTNEHESSDIESAGFVLQISSDAASSEDEQEDHESTLFTKGSNTLMTLSSLVTSINGSDVDKCKTNEQNPTNEGELNDLNQETFTKFNGTIIPVNIVDDFSKTDVSCEQCGQTYKTQKLLTNHILQEHDSEPF